MHKGKASSFQQKNSHYEKKRNVGKGKKFMSKFIMSAATQVRVAVWSFVLTFVLGALTLPNLPQRSAEEAVAKDTVLVKYTVIQAPFVLKGTSFCKFGVGSPDGQLLKVVAGKAFSSLGVGDEITFSVRTKKGFFVPDDMTWIVSSPRYIKRGPPVLPKK